MTEASPFPVLGIGTIRCEAFIAYANSDEVEIKDDLELNVFSWSAGFFSGLNLFATESLVKDLSDSSIEKDALIARLLGRCYENRDATLVEELAGIYAGLPE
tara:strand:- start:70 stop:375 length:306 start_codon:yes stop_codon:yes gene_type:complete